MVRVKSVVSLRIVDHSELETLLLSHLAENPIELEYMDLCDIDLFAGNDLTNASFKGSHCYQLDLEYCNLTGCDFSGVLHIETINFNGCTMDASTYGKLKSMGADFPSSVNVIDGSGKKVGISSGPDDSSAIPLLTVAGVENVQKVLLAHNDENPAQLINYDLSSLDLFKGRDLRGVSFRGSDCYEIDFSGSDLTGCDFTNTRSLETCNFSDATMDSATYTALKKGNARFDDTVKIAAE